jgi:hypothetical protein
MIKKTVTSFISSKSRRDGEQIYDFMIEFPENSIICDVDDYIKINVISFDMINTMYNINHINNKFKIITHLADNTDDNLIYIIPPGNYNVKTLRDWLNDTLLEPLTFSYNSAQNTYSISKRDSNDPNNYSIINMSNANYLGLANNQEYYIGSRLDTDYINLVPYNKVILKTENLIYSNESVENIHNTNSRLSYGNILFWKSKQDVEPFKNISYSNEDSGNSFNMTVQNKRIDYIQLQLKNEYNEFITDASDYLLVLQFEVYEKNDWIRKNVESINRSIRDIYVSILWMMESMKLLK